MRLSAMGRRCSLKGWPISMSWSKSMTQLPKTLVRPRGTVGSITAAIIYSPFSVVLITVRNVNEDQQGVGIAIFRSFTP